ncbi:MAG TPA: hypothetical protein DDZ96_10020 [Porphyromonadaceae bacterium]|jgi:hypothetical protein|nr:hypothetical protein [Porphyromonadaceae bacterium]HBK31506.1 hypothetical protein [Porphyromonadaceae bacterium]HBL34134.1 hypothetical protein [Porphyromonadaceae bacterium]HBX19771.1 hypothetical protein [Porphyromonadaceae bacterium]HCM19410.1 hypothetical protein [Porphyromonadaceae bacterium]
MKPKSIILTIFVMLIGACSKDDKINDESLRVAVRFNSQISVQQTRTTGGGDKWVEEDDHVGIYMVKHEEPETIVDAAVNVQYKATEVNADNAANAVFSPANTAQTIFFPQDGKKVNFVAYYPYKSGIEEEYAYPVNVGDQENQTAIDLLYATANNGGAGYNKTAGPVKLTFEHKLSKLAIKVERGAGIDPNSEVEVTIKKMNRTAEFDLRTGNLIYIEEPATTDITPYYNTASETYEAILLPVTSIGDEQYVEFEVEGDTYRWQIKNNIPSLEAGKKYAYTIAISRAGLRGTKCAITEWISTIEDDDALEHK